jgi:hypothetical protein
MQDSVYFSLLAGNYAGCPRAVQGDLLTGSRSVASIWTRKLRAPDRIEIKKDGSVSGGTDQACLTGTRLDEIFLFGNEGFVCHVSHARATAVRPIRVHVGLLLLEVTFVPSAWVPVCCFRDLWAAIN